MPGSSLDLNIHPQLDIFEDLTPLPTAIEEKKPNSDVKRKFVSPDPRQIYLGGLERHLNTAGQTEPLVVAQFLDQLDWSEFEDRYSPTGRPAFAPRNMIGLILYGILQGKTSLRELERLARLDIGCMWVSGGINPDHSSVGRFIIMHDESIIGSFFESLTGLVLTETQSDSELLAGDGTTVEAVASRYNHLQGEAVKARLEEAKARQVANPDSAEDQQTLAQAEQVNEVYETRKAAREEKGEPTDRLSVSPTEPEAVVQRQKQKNSALSYTPSVLANLNRIVTAMAIDPTNEVGVVANMLELSKRVTGSYPNEVVFDGGYFCHEIIQTTLAREISLICSEGRGKGGLKAGKLYPKGRFRYIPLEDVYLCPAGERLTRTNRGSGLPYYTTAACGACLVRDKCTKAKRGRRIKRELGDEEKEYLREILQHPQAKAILRKRQSMVEPVFSVLRLKQGLNRFRRKGLKGVRREFALHILAYNLSRYLAIGLYCAFFSSLLALYRRFKDFEVLSGQMSANCLVRQ